MEIEKKAKVLTIAVIVLAAALVGNVLYPILTVSTPEQKKAEFLKNLKEVLLDGQYDESALLLELNRTDINYLKEYFRPVILLLYYHKNETSYLVYTRTTMGMLIDKYVLTSPSLFDVLAYEDVQYKLRTGEMTIKIKLMADVGQEESWKFEFLTPRKILEEVAILERTEGPFLFLMPKEFPFALGRIEDLNLGGRQDILYGIGCLPVDWEIHIMFFYQGQMEIVGTETRMMVFSAPITYYDWGGPIFAIRDGSFELIGFVYYGEGGKASAIYIRKVFDLLESIGFKIGAKFKE